jgi:hypothetical protein
MLAAVNTSKKKSLNKGPKLRCESVNDFCRICELNLRITRSCSENLFKPSDRKDSKGTVLAIALKLIGLQIDKSPTLSERVCSSCGRKIRNALANISFLREKLGLATSGPLSDGVAKEKPYNGTANGSTTESTPCSSPSTSRQKRLLPNTITPERRACKHGNARSHFPKQLFETEPSSTEQTENDIQAEPAGLQAQAVICVCEPDTPFPREDEIDILQEVQNNVKKQKAFADCLEDKILSHFNIDAIDLSRKESQVRVVVAYPCGEVVVKHDFDKLTSTIIRNMASKNWQTVANLIFKHDEISKRLPDPLRRQVSSEFQSFSNKVLVHETRLKCPFWYVCMNGAVGLDLRQNDNRRSKVINAMAASISILARARNPTLSAFAYRISLLLFNGGVSYYDTIRLNHLGMCMSPKRTVELQKKMGNSTDSKVLIWKKSIEQVISATNLLLEIKNKQIPQRQDDDMVVDLQLRSKKTY